MIVCVPSRLMIFFQTVFSATEAAKLPTSHRASALQQSSARAVIAPSAIVIELGARTGLEHRLLENVDVSEWVIRVTLTACRSLPVYPDNQTSPNRRRQP
jgi:hypothetical protein